MKRIAFLPLVFCIVGIVSSTRGLSEESASGSSMFRKRCVQCHDRNKDQTVWGLGPSLKQISEAYKGREDDMAKFLKGGCKPIVDESRFPIMHGEVIKISELPDAQIKALVRFVCQQPRKN